MQIRVAGSATASLLETSGGEHTQALCQTIDHSKILNVRQRIVVFKVVIVNLAATATDICRVHRGAKWCKPCKLFLGRCKLVLPQKVTSTD